MKPPTTSTRQPEQTVQNPKRRFTGGRIMILILAVIVAIVAAIKSGSLILLPLLIGVTLVPLWWLARLVDSFRRDVITTRIRAGSSQLITFSRPPYVYHRKSTPFHFWVSWLIEGALFLFITPFLWVIVLGPIIEGGPGQ